MVSAYACWRTLSGQREVGVVAVVAVVDDAAWPNYSLSMGS